MGYAQSLIIALLASQAMAGAVIAGERTTLQEPAAVSRPKNPGQQATKDARMTVITPLDRVATAVDGAESSHGKDTGMWRPDALGPQGPMQVSEAAATNVGGGDRFDLSQNRALGRAYLAQLYERYRNWPDAVAAYNWGLGKVDAWVRAGRPPDKLLFGVAVYLRRVLHESGLCEGSDPTRMRQPSEVAGQRVALPPDSMVHAACSAPDGWDGTGRLGGGPSRFSKKLDQAMRLALQRALGSP
jgi:hypothetical protein